MASGKCHLISKGYNVGPSALFGAVIVVLSESKRKSSQEGAERGGISIFVG
jgi:hypothetical protein